jgi:hypothetical protein
MLTWPDLSDFKYSCRRSSIADLPELKKWKVNKKIPVISYRVARLFREQHTKTLMTVPNYYKINNIAKKYTKWFKNIEKIPFQGFPNHQNLKFGLKIYTIWQH